MSLRVWPRAPQSGVNETSIVVNIDDSISGAREVDNDNDNVDDDNDDTINNGRGTAIPKHWRLRQGKLRRSGGNVGNDDDCGKGDCNSCGKDKEGDMVMRQQHNAATMTTKTMMTMATRQQLHKVKSTSYA